MIALALDDPIRATAKRAAERELRIVKEAMRQPDSLRALWAALNDHRVWMHRLIGGTSGPTWNYMTERIQVLTAGALAPDCEYLADAKRRIEVLILEGEATYAR